MQKLTHHQKPKRRWRIPALSRMMLAAAEPEDDELIEEIDAAGQPEMVLESAADGEALVNYWNGVETEIETSIDDDFELQDFVVDHD